MALSSADRTRIRRKIGDTGVTPAFSDSEIADTYEEQGESLLKTVVALIDELLMSASRLTDYTQNATSEKRSQVFAQLERMRAIYESQVSAGKQQVLIVNSGLPRRDKDTP